MVEPPVLLLVALHLESMLSMPTYFWRMRRLERELRTLSGVLKVHRWLSRRSLMLTVWCRGRATAESCLKSAGLLDLQQRAGEGRPMRLWAEMYALLPGGLRLGAQGAPGAASAHAEGDPHFPEGREALGSRDEG